MTGTLDSHMNIAKALDVDITQLYTGIIKEEDKVDLKTSKSSTEMFVHSDKSSYEILTSNILSKKMMPILLKIEPDGKTNQEQNQAGTEKFIFVLDGKIEVEISDESSQSRHTLTTTSSNTQKEGISLGLTDHTTYSTDMTNSIHKHH